MRIRIELHLDGDSGLDNCPFVLMHNHPVITRCRIGKRIFIWESSSRFAGIKTLEDLAKILKRKYH